MKTKKPMYHLYSKNVCRLLMTFAAVKKFQSLFLESKWNIFHNILYINQLKWCRLQKL